MNRLTFLALVFAVSTTLTSAATKRVLIYYVGWNLETCVALSAADVRRTASVKTEITDGPVAEAFVRWLSEDKMAIEPKSKVNDLRLVIDAEQEDGSVWTYYADRNALFSVRSGKMRIISDSFRAHFSFFCEERG